MEKFNIILKDGTEKEIDLSLFEIDEEKQMVNLTKIAKETKKTVFNNNANIFSL